MVIENVNIQVFQKLPKYMVVHITNLFIMSVRKGDTPMLFTNLRLLIIDISTTVQSAYIDIRWE